ncbi:primosomal protein N' (replication factor Y) - superfamily II helicase [Phaeovulum vinaykumarii]|uniref:Primosomal protein N' (Replication factor Y)-superfamily II helicase n=1 Tax=Phaeovulum vinaykumarii TaxID=407234 RepID=A0A1N7JJY3_9RHOB|nr:primosomal protein N' (replication factor Y) - superfamily II helicase [Phaeovulum vinaykumarii]SIS49629.1 hypothetical protein SAMN05421795_10174 [Phaeovulum vinaykumarii]SOB89804.1 hypothetical protein SAMN05878426_10174 [Phaeovulum vinaykumarii]
MTTPAPAAPERHFPCDACGADLTFAPGQDHLECSYCGHEQEIPPAIGRGTADLRELPLAEVLDRAPAAEITDDLRLLSCPNCGAQIEITGPEHASTCPFCATPFVTGTGAQRQIKPQGLAPFVLSEAEAREAVTRWLGRLWFAPSGLVDYARKGRRMTGVYTPFWTFDARTRSRYSGMRGDAYYVTRTVMTTVGGKPARRQIRERKIRWSPASGQVARDFDDVLVLATTSLPRAHTAALQPWDLSALVPFQPEYLAGFSAEAYTIGPQDGHAEARDQMARVIRSDVRRAIGGDEQRISAIDTTHRDETCKHVLLPVWTAAYRYRGKSYRFVVNAQNGRVRGERPWSALKIALAVLAGAALAGGVYWWTQIQQQGGF